MLATALAIAGVHSMPVLNAATGMSSSTARACAITSSVGMARNCLMPRVSWAATAVTTGAGWQPRLASVSVSAASPAPAVGSVPPKASTTGIVPETSAERIEHPCAQRIDQPGMVVQRRRHPIVRDALGARERGVDDPELVQRLDVIRDERNRVHQHLARAGARLRPDHLVGVGPEPFERADAALVAQRDPGPAEARAHPRRGRLDLALVGIAALDHPARQSVGREQ